MPTSFSTGTCSARRRLRTSSSTIRFALEYSSLVVMSCPSDARDRSFSAVRSACVKSPPVLSSLARWLSVPAMSTYFDFWLASRSRYGGAAVARIEDDQQVLDMETAHPRHELVHRNARLRIQRVAAGCQHDVTAIGDARAVAGIVDEETILCFQFAREVALDVAKGI